MLTASYSHLILQGLFETFIMVFTASLLGILFGLIVGVILLITQKNHLAENSTLYFSLNLIVNITRSIPFIIFLIAIIPLTKLITGSTIGLGAAIVPLTLAAIPFYARIVESALSKVSPGLIDAALSMGANLGQIILKILIPEALPGLIQGATLTIISLVGYSAMAGAVGGGGLGQLAIEYGYQRFEIPMMVATVSLLILLVQILQWVGDHLAKTKKLRTIALFSLLSLIFLTGLYFQENHTEHKTLKIGITGGPQEKILSIAKKMAKEKYDIDLKIIVFNDYILPNQALASDDLDANLFQHIPYLKAQKKIHNYPINWVAKTFVYPMGFYSQKIKNLKTLPEQSLVAIPNDPSNEGRALLLLQHCQLIRLKKEAGLFATPIDIIDNPKHLQFTTLDAAQIPRALNSVTLAGITNDYLSVTEFTPKQALCLEAADSPYANIIVTKESNRHNPLLKKFITIMHSKAIIDATYEIFPDGGAIPAFKLNQ
jgi:D-methionine transport system permease protein